MSNKEAVESFAGHLSKSREIKTFLNELLSAGTVDVRVTFNEGSNDHILVDVISTRDDFLIGIRRDEANGDETVVLPFNRTDLRFILQDKQKQAQN